MNEKEKIFKRGILGTYIIGSVPSYQLLDSICNNKEEVFIFVDFNNNIKGLYYPEMLELVLQEISSNNGVFPSILINEWMIMQNYFEEYARLRNIKKFHVVYFSEGGQSYYHKNLYKDYKKGRTSAVFALPPSVTNNYKSYEDIQDLIRGFLVSSWKWIEILSRKANILSIRLENLDADFIPELLLRKFDIYNDNATYLILSSDGDMLQTLDIADNVYIYDSNTNSIITDKNWTNSKRYFDPNKKKANGSEVLQENHIIEDLSPDKVILFKALVGDSSDHIPGIKGIGVKTFFNSFIQIIPNDVRCDDIDAILNICEQRKSDNKVCKKVVSNIEEFTKMIKLVSFKMVIEWLQQNIQRYSVIKKIIDENYNALKGSCNLHGLQSMSQADKMLNS